MRTRVCLTSMLASPSSPLVSYAIDVLFRAASFSHTLLLLVLQVSHLVFRYFEPKSSLARVALLVVTPALLSLPVSYTGRSPYTAVPLAFTAYIGALLFFTLAYRLSPFHPLAKYPGPVIAKTSKWWAAYISARGDLHRYYKSLHDRYGDVIRIGWCRVTSVLFLFSSIYSPASRSQRTFCLRCFPDPSHTRPRWSTQRTTCVRVNRHTRSLHL